jgi:5-methyltetrahydrofolate--homocysteine methyltransferase
VVNVNVFYHLDGKGELPHLDQLLAIEELAGVQWVPGEGSPPLQEWPEVLNKIADSDKKIATCRTS